MSLTTNSNAYKRETTLIQHFNFETGNRQSRIGRKARQPEGLLKSKQQEHKKKNQQRKGNIDKYSYVRFRTMSNIENESFSITDKDNTKIIIRKRPNTSKGKRKKDRIIDNVDEGDTLIDTSNDNNIDLQIKKNENSKPQLKEEVMPGSSKDDKQDFSNDMINLQILKTLEGINKSLSSMKNNQQCSNEEVDHQGDSRSNDKSELPQKVNKDKRKIILRNKNCVFIIAIV